MTAFPQAQVIVWKKMGHHPQHERPRELAQFIDTAGGLDRAACADGDSTGS
jgi:pimeloyl-ACP methyl ester carboxylesterase